MYTDNLFALDKNSIHFLFLNLQNLRPRLILFANNIAPKWMPILNILLNQEKLYENTALYGFGS